MVKFARNGSDVTTAAVKLARAATGRDLIAICEDQPFFSTDDWFIGHTAMPAGIPQSIRDLTVGFRYNDLDSVRRLFAEHPGQVACLILEPATATEPAPGFLEGLRELCTADGALLVFDEMITGFRWSTAGAASVYGVRPDLTTFGKAMGNGFAIAALAGPRELMELGGIRDTRERVFLLSTTHGAETTALAAMLAVLETYEVEGVIERLDDRGQCLLDGPAGDDPAPRPGRARARHGPPVQPGVRDARRRRRPLAAVPHAVPPGADHAAASSGRRSSSARRLSDEDIDRTVEAVDEALAVYSRALSDGIDGYLRGRPVKPVFRPFA